MEAFSDGVVAILITIMVLELHPPGGTDWNSLRPVLPSVLAYALSFVYLGIYWNNHHHMLAVTDRVNGTILWANLHLLFWLSLVPFVTAWMGRNYDQSVPAALYGTVQLFAAISYTILQTAIINEEGRDSRLAQAIGKDFKGIVSIAFYIAGISLAFVRPWLGESFYIAVALMWLVPDRRIEERVQA
jgi:uncharacterized membrane protein